MDSSIFVIVHTFHSRFPAYRFGGMPFLRLLHRVKHLIPSRLTSGVNAYMKWLYDAQQLLQIHLSARYGLDVAFSPPNDDGDICCASGVATKISIHYITKFS